MTGRILLYEMFDETLLTSSYKFNSTVDNFSKSDV